jgi:hypothetical protein
MLIQSTQFAKFKLKCNNSYNTKMYRTVSNAVPYIFGFLWKLEELAKFGTPVQVKMHTDWAIQ